MSETFDKNSLPLTAQARVAATKEETVPGRVQFDSALLGYSKAAYALSTECWRPGVSIPPHLKDLVLAGIQLLPLGRGKDRYTLESLNGRLNPGCPWC